jgi:hypothetical protein
MKRLLLPLLLAGLPLTGSAPASACAPPEEGPPRCCQSYLYYTEVAGHGVGVPDPSVKLYCD